MGLRGDRSGNFPSVADAPSRGFSFSVGGRLSISLSSELRDITVSESAGCAATPGRREDGLRGW